MAQAIHGKEEVGAYRLGCLCCGGLKSRHGGIKPGSHHQRERRGAEGAGTVAQLHRHRVCAVGHVAQVGLNDERRVAQVAWDGIKGAQCFDHAHRRRGRAPIGPLPQGGGGHQRSIERDRRRVNLLYAHGPASCGVGHLPVGARHQRTGKLRLWRPRPSRQHGGRLRIEPPQLRGAAQSRRGGDLHIE